MRFIQSSDPLPPALNTLDLLKKGSTPLAQRARTASRVLESQVGTNPRVRVQQDAAFVLWDKITFDEDPTITTASDPNANASVPSSASPSPEWVRRTICCAQWETEHADIDYPRVVLAALAQQPPQCIYTRASSVSCSAPSTTSCTATQARTTRNRFSCHILGPSCASRRARGTSVRWFGWPRVAGRSSTGTQSSQPPSPRPRGWSGRRWRYGGATSCCQGYDGRCCTTESGRTRSRPRGETRSVKTRSEATSQRTMSVREDPLFTWIFVLD